MKLYGKVLPAEDTFMFHYVDGETGESIISCHSMHPNMFNLIGKVAPLVRRTIEEKKCIVDNSIYGKNNYWNKSERNALQHGIPTIAYLSLNDFLPERNAEYTKMLTKSSRITEKITDFIKKSIITAKKSTICEVKKFFDASRNVEKDDFEK